MSVFVPSHRHLPGGCGLRFTGTLVAASSCEVTATIGCENVMLSSGASGILPSGEYRTTSSGPAVTVSALLAPGAGNETSTVLPVRGGGNEPSRSANS